MLKESHLLLSPVTGVASSHSPNVRHVAAWVDDAIKHTPVYDLHTHLYPASFGPLMSWGVDELIPYPSLIAKSIRGTNLPYEKYWAMDQAQRADFIWNALFIER